MDRRIALKWARALESGEYEQTQGQLRSSDGGFCCLGVLCNLHAQAHPEIAAGETEPTEYLGNYADLPVEVMEWAGIRETEGEFVDELGFKSPIEFKLGPNNVIEDIESLVDMNDTHELNFQQIAKVIRKHSDKL